MAGLTMLHHALVADRVTARQHQHVSLYHVARQTAQMHVDSIHPLLEGPHLLRKQLPLMAYFTRGLFLSLLNQIFKARDFLPVFVLLVLLLAVKTQILLTQLHDLLVTAAHLILQVVDLLLLGCQR